MATDRFSGQILVASRIVDTLSSGLYETPAACLKELVNNSFDADATTVKVFVKPEANRIIVADDGIGISKREFERHFSRVSESHKRDLSQTSPSGWISTSTGSSFHVAGSKQSSRLTFSTSDWPPSNESTSYE